MEQQGNHACRPPINGRWRGRRRRGGPSDRVVALVVPREPWQDRVRRRWNRPVRAGTVRRREETRHDSRRCQLEVARRWWWVAAAEYVATTTTATCSCWWRWRVAVDDASGGWRREARVRADRCVVGHRRGGLHGDHGEEDGDQGGSRHVCVSVCAGRERGRAPDVCSRCTRWMHRNGLGSLVLKELLVCLIQRGAIIQLRQYYERDNPNLMRRRVLQVLIEFLRNIKTSLE